MNPLQESKQELNAAIRYAENAISSAKQTMESMNTYQEQTGREEALTKQVQELESKVQGQYDDIVMLEREVEVYTKKYNELAKQKEASSGPCGCQAYRDLEERADSLGATIQRLKRDEPTMPVIPKAVAIAIFREGVQHGVEAACTELDEATYIRIEESEYVGDFHVTFERDIDLNDHIDTDWMRGKCGDYSEERVIDALGTLCADKEFECRIHGIDDATIDLTKKND